MGMVPNTAQLQKGRAKCKRIARARATEAKRAQGDLGPTKPGQAQIRFCKLYVVECKNAADLHICYLRHADA